MLTLFIWEGLCVWEVGWVGGCGGSGWQDGVGHEPDAAQVGGCWSVLGVD